MNKFTSTLKIILLKMHFWLPLAFTVLFWIIAAATQTLQQAGLYYFIGLAITLVFSVILTYLTAQSSNSTEKEVKSATTKETLAATTSPVKNSYEPRESVMPDNRIPSSSHAINVSRGMTDEAYRKLEQEAKRLKEEQEHYTSAMKGQPDSKMNNNYMQPERQSEEYKPFRTDFMSPNSMNNYYGDAASDDEITSRAEAARHALYPDSPSSNDRYSSGSAKEVKDENKPNFTPYVQPHNAVSENSIDLEQYEKTHGRASRMPASESSVNQPSSHENEKPKIYRTRQDENVLVYEYSDCLKMYYVNPDNSLTYLKTERK